MNSSTYQLIDLVAGARPNFMKLAPVERALRATGVVRPRIVHTGQHYDRLMNDVFFADLDIPWPEVHLGVGSGTHGEQTGRILERYEAHLLENTPSATVVFGDVNSTIACALAAVKLGVPVIHVEAGLRSFDRSMPEEINRLLVDAISDLLLVTESSGVENLKNEGILESRIRLVGNVMIDSVQATLAQVSDSILKELHLNKGGYGLVTLHRPSNVDDPERLRLVLNVLAELAAKLPLVFPVHPRTRKAVSAAGLGHYLEEVQGLICLQPIGYRENLALMRSAKVVLTDSGGMQEETTFLRVPCLTMRGNTERPVTVELGTSQLVGTDPDRIRRAFNRVLNGDWPDGMDVPLWDGRAAERIAREIVGWFAG